MAFETLTLGLTLTLPISGTRNWGATMRSTTWTKISNHAHGGGGDGNNIQTAGIAANAITTAKLSANVGQTQYASLLAPVGTVQTVNWNNGNIQKLSLASASGDVTLTLSNPGTGHRYRLHVIQGATPRALVWPAAVLWANGVAPILSTDNGSVDVIELYYDGTNYYGDWDLAYA